jgi:hypothetical protein
MYLSSHLRREMRAEPRAERAEVKEKGEANIEAGKQELVQRSGRTQEIFCPGRRIRRQLVWKSKHAV